MTGVQTCALPIFALSFAFLWLMGAVGASVMCVLYYYFYVDKSFTAVIKVFDTSNYRTVTVVHCRAWSMHPMLRPLVWKWASSICWSHSLTNVSSSTWTGWRFPQTNVAAGFYICFSRSDQWFWFYFLEDVTIWDVFSNQQQNKISYIFRHLTNCRVFNDCLLLNYYYWSIMSIWLYMSDMIMMMIENMLFQLYLPEKVCS